MPLVLGVDGGNSKAVALVAQTDGTVVGAGRCLGSADIYAREPEAAVETVASAVADALLAAGAGNTDIGTSVFSMAGADWPEDFELLRALLAHRGLADDPLVVNDGIGALFGAVPDGPAVVISLGTGAATGARGRDGLTWHSSFWQRPHGAVELAQTAVAAVVRAALGTGPPTHLSTEIATATGDPDTEAVLHRFTRRGGVATRDVAVTVAALFRTADAGDDVAADILLSHGSGLGQLGAAAARRVAIDGEAYALGFCGGVVRAGAERLVDAAVTGARAGGQAPRVVTPRWEPAVGALVIGLLGGSDRLTSDVAEHLDATAPGADLYDVIGRPLP